MNNQATNFFRDLIFQSRHLLHHKALLAKITNISCAINRLIAHHAQKLLNYYGGNQDLVLFGQHTMPNAKSVSKMTTVKPVLSGHSKIDNIKIFMTNGSLMKVKSIAECSPWSILQYFRPSLSDNLS